MPLLLSHRLVGNNPNPFMGNISLSRAHLHGWREGQGTQMATVVSEVLAVIV